MADASDERSAGILDANTEQGHTRCETTERLYSPVLSSAGLNITDISVSDSDNRNSNSLESVKVMEQDSETMIKADQVTDVKITTCNDNISHTYVQSSTGGTVTSIEQGVQRLGLDNDVNDTDDSASVDTPAELHTSSGNSNKNMSNDVNITDHCDNRPVEMPSSGAGQTLCDRLNADLSRDNDNSDSDNAADNDEDEEAFHSAEENDDVKVDEVYLQQLEATMSDEEKQKRQNEARGYKDDGNSSFKQGLYDEAATAYTRGLQLCPLMYEKDRSIMYSNRAACYMRQEKYERAIGDSNKAVNLHPHYVKAISRRAQLYEKTEKLDEALADYQRVLELNPADHSAREASFRLPEQITQRNEKLKEDMMSKLKDLGNMVLKPFGLSTNNFQLQQDPNTGGYSVQFNQNGK